MAIIPPSIQNPESRVLILSQHRPPIAGSSWEFPAGMVDEGEDGLDAGAREFSEETGIQVGPESLIPLGNFNSSPTLASDFVHAYALVLPSDFNTDSVTVQVEEIEDYEWLTISDILERSLTNSDYSVTIPSMLFRARKLGLIEPLGL